MFNGNLGRQTCGTQIWKIVNTVLIIYGTAVSNFFNLRFGTVTRIRFALHHPITYYCSLITHPMFYFFRLITYRQCHSYKTTEEVEVEIRLTDQIRTMLCVMHGVFAYYAESSRFPRT